MRHIFLTAVAVVLFGSCSWAQGVISVCSVTGGWGTGYNEHGYPVVMKECEDLALKGCKDHGGKECKTFYKSLKGGWWAMMAGRGTSGPFYFAVTDGNTTQREAEAEVRRLYKAKGGPNPEGTQVSSWYVFSKLADMTPPKGPKKLK